MRNVAIGLLFCGLATLAQAQVAREITFFSDPGYRGARYTVTGPRTNLSIPFVPRSALLQGGASWEICNSRDYRGTCNTLRDSTRDLRFAVIRSARPHSYGGGGFGNWREIGRLNVRDRADRDTLYVRSNELFREVKVCSVRNTLRIRRAEVQLGNGNWQRMFVPPVLTSGRCSSSTDL
ncbi:MAG: hypothetical protein ACRETL_04300, partial [Gammaproteobacteria bacterium]